MNEWRSCIVQTILTLWLVCFSQGDKQAQKEMPLCWRHQCFYHMTHIFFARKYSSLFSPMNLSEHYLKLSEHFWTYLNLSEPIQTYLKISEPIQTYLNISKLITCYSNSIQTYLNLFEPIRTYLNVYSLLFLLLFYFTNALCHTAGSKQIFDNLWSS